MIPLWTDHTKRHFVQSELNGPISTGKLAYNRHYTPAKIKLDFVSFTPTHC